MSFLADAREGAGQREQYHFSTGEEFLERGPGEACAGDAVVIRPKKAATAATPRRGIASGQNLLQLSTSDLQPARTWDAAEADGVRGVRKCAVAAVAAFFG